MPRLLLSRLSLVASLGVALCVSQAGSQETVKEAELPEGVAKTFRARFPAAEILKLTAEDEGGVMVYDFEFKDGEVERETDIAADGTMLEITLVVAAEDVPPAAMQSITKHAKDAQIGRLEKIDISYEIDAGEIVKLPAPVTHYAAELSKRQGRAEVVVKADGGLVERPQWVEVEAKPKGEGK